MTDAHAPAPTCPTPKPKRRLLNTLWACPNCPRVWVLRQHFTYADDYRVWREL